MAGRDVVFRLKVEDSAGNKDVLSRFATEHAKTQKRIDAAGVNGAKQVAQAKEQLLKKSLSDEQKKQEEHTKWISKTYEKAEQQDFQLRRRMREQEIAADKKREQEFLSWRQKIRANSAKLEQSEGLRIRRDEDRALAQELRNSYRQSRIHQAAERRREAIVNRIGRGASGFIGSVGGFIGGDTGSALGNIALGGHLGLETYEKGRGLVGGIGALRNPGLAAGSGAAVAAGAPIAAAGAVALIAWLPALAAAVRGATIAIKGSESTARVSRGGSLGSAFGEGIAGSFLNPYRWGEKGTKDTSLQQMADAGGTYGDYSGLELSRRSLVSQQAGNARLSQSRQLLLARAKALSGNPYRAERDWAAPSGIGSVSSAASLGKGLLGTSTFFNPEQMRATEERLGGIRQSQSRSAFEEQAGLRSARFGRAGLYNELSSAQSAFKSSDTEELRSAAVERVKNAEGQILAQVREEQRISLQSARDRLSSAKEEYEIKKQMADEAKRSYQSDITKFALASPEERERIRAISQKQRTGQHLTRGELQEAQGYSSFGQYADKEAERIANELGAGDIFGGARSEKDRLAKDAASAREQEQQAEVQVEQLHRLEVVIKSDEALSQVVLKGFVPFLKELDQREKALQEKMKKEFEEQLRRMTGNKRLPGL